MMTYRPMPIYDANGKIIGYIPILDEDGRWCNYMTERSWDTRSNAKGEVRHYRTRCPELFNFLATIYNVGFGDKPPNISKTEDLYKKYYLSRARYKINDLLLKVTDAIFGIH